MHAALVVLDLSGTVRPVVEAARKAVAGAVRHRGRSRHDLRHAHAHRAAAAARLAHGRHHEGELAARRGLHQRAAGTHRAVGEGGEGEAGSRRRPPWPSARRRASASTAACCGKAGRKHLAAAEDQSGHRASPPDRWIPRWACSCSTARARLPRRWPRYLNFAMHPTSVGGGVKISADYPGVFTKLVSERHGRGHDLRVRQRLLRQHQPHRLPHRQAARSTLELGTALADAATAVVAGFETAEHLRAARPLGEGDAASAASSARARSRRRRTSPPAC